MKKSVLKNLLLCQIFAAVFTPSIQAEILTVSTPEALRELLATNHPDQDTSGVLVVTDLDNTLLELDQDIGSEHWFLWQAGLIKDAAAIEKPVARSVPDLLSLQSLITNLVPTHLVHSSQRELYNSLVERGANMIALTSRMIDNRDTTERELARQGLTFINKSLPLDLIGQNSNSESRGLIFDSKNPQDSGLTTQILSDFKVTTSKPVAYSKGVLYTEGQNKGVMLASFLHRTKISGLKSVIFLDDRIHHVEAVEKAMTALRPDLSIASVHLTISRPKVEAFEKSNKQIAKNQFCKFLGVVEDFWSSSNNKPWNPEFDSCVIN